MQKNLDNRPKNFKHNVVTVKRMVMVMQWSFAMKDIKSMFIDLCREIFKVFNFWASLHVQAF